MLRRRQSMICGDVINVDMDSTTALRELYEETGYGSGKAGQGNAEVGQVSSVLVKDPG